MFVSIQLIAPKQKQMVTKLVDCIVKRSHIRKKTLVSFWTIAITFFKGTYPREISLCGTPEKVLPTFPKRFLWRVALQIHVSITDSCQVRQQLTLLTKQLRISYPTETGSPCSSWFCAVIFKYAFDEWVVGSLQPKQSSLPRKWVCYINLLITWPWNYFYHKSNGLTGNSSIVLLISDQFNIVWF